MPVNARSLAGSLFLISFFSFLPLASAESKASWHKTSKLCSLLLSKTLKTSNPLAELGNQKLKDLAQPSQSMKRYLLQLAWHREISLVTSFKLWRLLKASEGLQREKNPLTKDLEKSLDEIFVEISAGYASRNDNALHIEQRRNPKMRVFRPMVRRIAVLSQWTAITLGTLWGTYNIFNYVNARSQGLTENAILDSRMRSFSLELSRRWGWSERPSLSAKDQEAFLRGYHETESSQHHQIQYGRSNYIEFQYSIAIELSAIDLALKLKNNTMLEDSLFSIYAGWRIRPDILRTPEYGPKIDQRVQNIFDQFDPDRKLWRKFENELNEILDESARLAPPAP